MVIVSRKFNVEMPVGTLVQDVDLPELPPVEVIEGARTAHDGTEMHFRVSDGVKFWDLAKFYNPVSS